MTFKRKLFFSIFISLLLIIFSYLKLIDYQVASNQVKGRIIKIEKKNWVKKWRLVLFSNGDIYKMDIENIHEANELKKYKKKYISIDYDVYLWGGLMRSKYRVRSWSSADTKKNEESVNLTIKGIDKNLVCSLISILRNNKDLNTQVIAYFKERKLDILDISKKCGL